MNTAGSSGNVIAFPPRGLFCQSDLFAPSSTMASTGIVGLIVKLAHRSCRACAATHFIIGSSKAMHCARLSCAECGAFSGWMSRGDFTFARMTVERYGSPTTAFVVGENKKDF